MNLIFEFIGLPEILKWTDVVKSGVVAGAANILLLTILIADMGLIYVFSNFALVSAVVTIVYLAVMKFIQPAMEYLNYSYFFHNSE